MTPFILLMAIYDAWLRLRPCEPGGRGSWGLVGAGGSYELGDRASRVV